MPSSANESPEPIAIVGMACLFPNAPGLKEFWRLIRCGLDGITDIPPTHWSPDDYFDADPKSPDMTYCKRGGFLGTIPFDPSEFGIPPALLEATDTSQLLALLVAKRALDDAGYGETPKAESRKPKTDSRDPKSETRTPETGTRNPLDRSRVSVMLGVTGTQELVIPLGARLGHPIWRKALRDEGITGLQADQVVRRIADGYVSWQENSFPGLLGNVVAGRIANRLNLGGTNCVVDAACASSLSAIHLAMMELQTGKCDVALSGGVDALNDIFMHMCFSKTPALSPTGDARPFSSEADGTVLGEGIGIVVLKRLSDAVRDGDRVYAAIRSVGTSSDGRQNSIYAPYAAGQAEALRRAYRAAGVDPRTIELVEAHGTGTKVGDVVEFEALRTMYSEEVLSAQCAVPSEREVVSGQWPVVSEEDASQLASLSAGDSFRKSQASSLTSILKPQASDLEPWCAVGSVKSQIGHTKAAAGVAGLIKAALALHYKVLPPTLKVREPNAKLQIEGSPLYINSEARPWTATAGHPRRAAVSSFGFGGSNFHLVLEEDQASRSASDQRENPAWDGSVEIIPLSANRADELNAAVAQWQAALSGEFTWAHLAHRAADARAHFSSSHSVRLVIVLERPAQQDASAGQKLDPAVQDARNVLDQIALELNRNSAGSWTLPNAYFGVGPAAGKLAMLFPGQGSQRVNMARELACVFPEMAEAIAEAGVRDAVYPRHAFADAERDAQEAALTRTEVAQPALGAVSLGVLRVLERFGVRPDAAAGHSFGELVALHAAGRIDAPTLHQLARQRGAVMAAEGGDDAGTMLAVRGPIAEIEQLVLASKTDAVLANYNAPQQGVVSGSREAIGQIAGLCRQRGWATQTLAVSAAFHSRRMAAAQAAFRRALKQIKFVRSRMPVFANSTGQAYPDDPAAAGDLLAGQITSPVRFVQQIDGLYAMGARVFVEVGPRTVLSGLTRSILGARAAHVLAVEASGGSRGGLVDLARLLARLGALGAGVDFSQWEESKGEPAKPRMSVALTGANYRAPRATIPPSKVSQKEISHEQIAQAQNAQMQILKPRILKTQISQQQISQEQIPQTQSALVNDHSAAHARPLPPGAMPAVNSQSNGRESMNAAAPVDAGALVEALRVVQDGLHAMQQLQQQTAAAHQRFLEGQTVAHQAFQSMMAGQQRLLERALGMPVSEACHLAAPAQPDPPSPRERTVAAPHRAPCAFDQIARSTNAPRSLDQNVATAGASRDELTHAVLCVVSEKTGYPLDQVSLDFSLADDLGIDAVRLREIADAIVSRRGGEATSSETLMQLQTVGELVECVRLCGTRRAGTPRLTALDRMESPRVNPGSRNSGADARHSIAPRSSNPRFDVQNPPSEVHPPQSAIRNPQSVVPAGEGKLHPQAHAQTQTSSRSQSPTADTFSPVLLSVVSELTGYPLEMLALDMDMESDLGIDSIKRVEILAAVQERVPGATAVNPEYMGSLRTLRQIVEYSTGGAGADADDNGSRTRGNGPAAVAVGASSSDSGGPPRPFDVAPMTRASGLDRRVLGAVDLPALAEVAIKIAANHEVWLVADDGPLSAATISELQRRGIHARRFDFTTIPKADEIEAVAGLIILAPNRFDAIALWHVESEKLIRTAFQWTKLLSPALHAALKKGGAFLATVARMDGMFGLSGGAFDAAQGALAGLTKTAAQEWPGVVCRAMDVDGGWNDTTAIAAAIACELGADAPVEIGLHAGGRRGLALTPRAGERDSVVGRNVGSDLRTAGLSATDVVVITGGARGVTAEAAVAIAQAWQPRIVLVGRSSVPSIEPDWLSELRDVAAMKRAILQNEFAGGVAKPAQIEASYRRYVAGREISQTLERIRAAGSRVEYLSLDVRDEQAVRAALQDVISRVGMPTVVIHGAGVLEDKRIEDKTAAQFDAVFDTKVVGLRNLLAALDLSKLRHLMLFSSVTARLGRLGQVDYAMANELLNKAAQRFARIYPHCHVAALNWGPWEGGMVTPSLRKEFARQGVSLIPLEAGVAAVVEELSNAAAGERAVEVILGASWSEAESQSAPSHAASSIANVPRELFRRELVLRTHSFLESHVIGGKPVLPVAMIAEWFAHAALAAHPKLRFAGIDDLRILRGVKWASQAMPLRVVVRDEASDSTSASLELELHGEFGVPHARGRVLLVADLPIAPRFEQRAELAAQSFAQSVESIYRDFLFHGPAFQAIEAIDGHGPGGLVARLATAPSPHEWMESPHRAAWITDPLILDAGFQLGIVWCQLHLNAPSLPAYGARYRQYRERFGPGPITAALEVRRTSSHRMTGDITYMDAAGAVVARVEGCEWTVDASLAEAFRAPVSDGAVS